MRSVLMIGCLGMLVITTGCGGGEETSQQPTPSPSVAVTKPTPTTKTFDKPPMVAEEPVDVKATAGLIQPTNYRERTRAVEKGRQDPFALLPGQVIPVAPTITPATPSSRVPQLPIIRRATAPLVAQPRPNQPVRVQQTGNRNIAGRTSRPRRATVRRLPTGAIALRQPRANLRRPAPPNRSTVATRVRQTTKLPPVIPSSPIQPVLPPPPQPELAAAVAVTGVVQVGNRVEAIVQVPNEPTSRYVREGQRLSNGQVLVKRIEMNEGSVPVVILEQYGIEVARAVGEEPVKATQPGRAAALPTLQQNPLTAGA